MKHLPLVVFAACSVELSSEPDPWFERWDQARACIVSAEPTAELGDAIALTRLTGIVCELPRPPKGFAEIAKLIDDVSGESSSRVRANLVTQIDAEVAALRDQGMPLPGAPLPMLTAGKLAKLDGKPIARNTIIAFGPRLHGQMTVEGSRVDYWETDQGMTRASTDADEAAALPTRRWFVPRGTSFAIRRDGYVRETRVPAHYGVHALDVPTARLVVVHESELAAALRSDDDGATWEMEGFDDGGVVVLQDHVTGTIDLYLVDAMTRHRYWLDVDGKLEHSVSTSRLPRNFAQTSTKCWANGVLWVASRDGVTRSAQSHITWLARSSDARPRILACGMYGAVVHYGDTVQHCTAWRCESLPVPPRPKGAAAVRADGSWIYSTSFDGVVGIWREHGSPHFHRLSDPGEVIGVRLAGHRLQLGIATLEGVRIVNVAD